MTEVISVEDTDSATQQAIDVLRSGRLVVLPTDTVYTVIADAFQNFATQRLFGAKRRSKDVPLSLLIRNPRQVIGLASDVPETAERIMASYWPGPVTIVLHSQPDMPWELGRTNETVSLRMPAADLVLAVAAEIGPLACSAANRRGEAPATTIEEAKLQLGSNVDLYIDGGVQPSGVTTIVDCTRAEVEVLREGLVPADDILRVAAGDVGWGQQPPDATPPAAPTDDTESSEDTPTDQES